jgi:hypothetical protein
MSRESMLGLPVGCIYLTIYNHLGDFRERSWDPELVLFDFGTPGTSMSLLFVESDAIRVQFIHLLEKYHGVCGVLNLEDTGKVIWLGGRRVDVEIPDPYMTPAEIEGFLGSKKQHLRGERHTEMQGYLGTAEELPCSNKNENESPAEGRRRYLQ